MSSREIAELVVSSHDSVLKTVRSLSEKGLVLPNETSYVHPQNGQTYPEFLLSFRDTMLVASGYSAELRAKIIDRWQELENATPQKTLTPAEALHQMTGFMVEQERRVAVIEDKVKRIEANQQAFDEGLKRFTVVGFFVFRGLPALSLTDTAQFGKRAAALSRERGVLIDRVRDPRFGLVGSYHEDILQAVLDEFMDIA